MKKIRLLLCVALCAGHTPFAQAKTTKKSSSHARSSSAAKKSAQPDESSLPPEPLPSPAPSASPASTPRSAPNASLEISELSDFASQPGRVQKLLETALALTKQNLTYIYGSDDPANGGMDCSGFVSFVLRKNAISGVPRDASGQYVWVRKADNFEAVLSRKKDSFELEHLRPGDLLFWTGTYTTEKDPPVTHAMIYLGKEKSGKRVMVGASDGRTYDGVSRWGVSVFDFKTSAKPPGPEAKTAPMFVGYGSIPGLRE